MLNEGDLAPPFRLTTDSGSIIDLSSLAGAPVVIYFYPKDDTSGCTKEAVGFTQKRAAFDDLGAKIIGISPDSVEKHQKFKKKHDLDIILAADEDREVAKLYGVWAEKKMYGRTYMGIVRTTFLVDRSGKIARIWNRVRVKGHAEAVLEATESL